VGEGIRYLATQPGIELEYLEVRALDLDPVITAGPARLFVAITIGDVRLIDNIEVEIGEENVARH
jgi:pantoate--beta-alanine ligase